MLYLEGVRAGKRVLPDKTKSPRHSFLYLGRINKSAVPPIIDVKSTLSYTNIYAAKITDAVSVAPYLLVWYQERPRKSIQPAVSYLASTCARLSVMQQSDLLLFLNGLCFWLTSS